MNTIDELVEFCKEKEPVGALLLSGEWGCGKTYLIENEFKEKISDFAVILRISLFGMMEIDEIHTAINNAWIDEYCKQKNLDTVLNYISKGQKLLGKLDFLPDSIKGIGTTNLSDCVPIKNVMDDKSVILVFDDLERCHINIVDVLGLINDYCENSKYHTIVIANQEKIIKSQNPIGLTAEIQYGSNTNTRAVDNKFATIKINKQEEFDKNDISYTEIKEKIIQRTVLYQPNYYAIVSNVIENLKCGDNDYRAFIKENMSMILELFAPEGADESDKRPHNIRSLKCAINDFFRVYLILKENEIENIQYWLYSFVAYVISYKADIAKEGYYGTLFSDNKVKEFYPAFHNDYIFSPVKKWILHGIWDEKAILFEIETIKKRKEERKASEILRYNRIMDIDEDLVSEGFDELLRDAYEGDFTLNDYVLFIENCSWARKYEFEFPEVIDWDKVYAGINIRIEELKEHTPEGQLLYRTISEDNKQYFDEKEWAAYETISDFAFKGIIYYKNRMLYLDAIKNNPMTALMFIQNKRFNLFDEEMSMATSDAFLQLPNSEKIDFNDAFKRIWKANVLSEDFESSISQNGFLKLKEHLIDIAEEYTKSKKTFSSLHTLNFIKSIDELIELIKNS